VWLYLFLSYYYPGRRFVLRPALFPLFYFALSGSKNVQTPVSGRRPEVCRLETGQMQNPEFALKSAQIDEPAQQFIPTESL
jgi:hypothetical protein